MLSRIEWLTIGVAAIACLLAAVLNRIDAGSVTRFVVSAAAPAVLAALGLAGIVGAFVVYAGESTWLAGVVLIGLYGIITATFWWG